MDSRIQAYLLLHQNLDLKWDKEILILNSFDFYLGH